MVLHWKLHHIVYQSIDHKMSVNVAHLEEEEQDIFDITLLRFLAAFVYVYLAFELIAGIVQVSSGHLNEFFPGWVTIILGLLGIAEVTALLIFLMELKRKVWLAQALPLTVTQVRVMLMLQFLVQK